MKHRIHILGASGSGAVCGWGDRLKPRFDLVIFLNVPNEIRLERLRQREAMRYGDAVLPGGSMYEGSDLPDFKNGGKSFGSGTSGYRAAIFKREYRWASRRLNSI